MRVGRVLLLACAAAAGGPRVRREIRSVAPEIRDRVFAAFEVMRNTSRADGEARYGRAFRTYQSITVQHTYAAIDARCDQGHLSAGFFPYHRALVLAVEASVLAVDPGVGALPYWDYNVDLALPDPAASEIWSDAFFGEAAGDPDDAYMIRTGPWRDWTVDKGDLFAGPPRYDVAEQRWVDGARGNAYGYLRGLTNQNPAPRLTRRHAICGAELPWFGGGVNGSTWDACVAKPTFLEFWDCFDAGIDGPHPFGHIWLGGAWGAKDGNCAAKQLDTATAEIVAGCLVVPNCTGKALEDCVLVRDDAACARMREPNATCQRYGGGGSRPAYAPDAACKACPECADGQFGAAGDFWDGSTSTNDPIFSVRIPTAGLGGPHQTSELSSSVKIDVDSADFWTNRSLSSSSRSTAENLASKLSRTLTLKLG
jgi:hypothetical protein